MSDIRKVREVREKDDGDWEDWPYPILTIESVVSGGLRAIILARLNAPDTAEVRLIETCVSGGYSEFTQEDDYGIEVLADGASAWKHEYGTSAESSMARFLAEFGPPVPSPGLPH